LQAVEPLLYRDSRAGAQPALLSSPWSRLRPAGDKGTRKAPDILDRLIETSITSKLGIGRPRFDAAGVHRDEAVNWMTTKEAAQYLKVPPRTLLDWARRGSVKGYMLSGTERHVWRFLQEDLDAALLTAVQSSQSSANLGR
jgi:excisionase family DNA binding protein